MSESVLRCAPMSTTNSTDQGERDVSREDRTPFELACLALDDAFARSLSGRVRITAVRAACEAAGVSWGTLRRAARERALVTVNGGSAGSFWERPGDDDNENGRAPL